MGFRIDLIDPVTGLKTGRFPVLSVGQVKRTTALDRVGKWEFSMAVSDPAYPEIEGKNFRIYWQHDGGTYDLGLGSYLTHQVDAGGLMATVQASGSLRDLTRQTVLQRSFDGATDDVNDVLNVIVPLRSGWTLGAVDTISSAAPLDFWYETIYDSVALLAETFGYHYREGAAVRTLDFGAMGASSGILAWGGSGAEPGPGMAVNPAICQITQIQVDYQGDGVVNRLIPFGGAVGVATIDLSLATVTQPGYPVQSAALPGGGSYYYIEDAASIATYGLTEARFLRKDLRPISNAPAARQYAANILYEAALASLLNLKDRQTIYSLSVTGWAPGAARVGDKIRVRYQGVAWNAAGDAQVWLDLDNDFYLLELNESFGEGVEAELKINLNAVQEETVADLLASTIQSFEQSQIHVQPTISRYTVGPYTKRVAASPAVGATFSFNLGLETLTVWYVKMQLVGEPLKSSVAAVATGGSSTQTSTSGGSSTQTSTSGGSSTPTTSSGSHIHYLTIKPWSSGGNVMYYTGGSNYVRSGGSDAVVETTGDAGGGHRHTVTIASHTHDVTIPSHTHDVTIPGHTHDVTIPGHTHSMTYGIYADTVYPDSLTIKINGATVASGVTLAAPNYDYELDITAIILAAGSLQQDHTIVIEPASGRGEICFQAQVLAVIQGIEV